MELPLDLMLFSPKKVVFEGFEELNRANATLTWAYAVYTSGRFVGLHKSQIGVVLSRSIFHRKHVKFHDIIALTRI